MSGELLVRVDGELIDRERALGLWQRFSEHMDAHPRDLHGFATKEGYLSVVPGLENGRPVLLLSTRNPQGAYRSATEGSGGGSDRPHRGKR